MTEMQIIWLSLLQGITEFLPVSSSGHLILFSKFTNFPDQGAAIDIALHIGSIIAVTIYFAPVLWKMFKGLLKTRFLPNMKIEEVRVFYMLVIAAIPALLCGAVLEYFGTEWLRSTKFIGWNILIYALLLWIIDTWSIAVRQVKNLEVKDAVLIGFAQCLALLPGTSRSGITITMGRFLGLERREAAKFSMLLSIPTIIAAGFLAGYKLWREGSMQMITDACNAIGYSFAFSLLSIFILMQWLRKWSFLPFVIYRIVLGGLLLVDAYGIYDVKLLFN